MSRAFLLSAVTASSLSFATALALVPVSALAEGLSTTEVYENLLDLESQAVKDLHHIRQLKRSLESQAGGMDEQELITSQRKTRKAIKTREDRMWRESEKYRKLIKQRLSVAWYPPTSSKKHSPAWLQITLSPNGDLALAEIGSSSGSAEYDDSVLDAAKSIQRYPVPSSSDIFQRHFQQITIEFNPQKLRWM